MLAQQHQDRRRQGRAQDESDEGRAERQGAVLVHERIRGFGGGTVGGTARVKGVFAGVDGGVGGRPSNGFTSPEESVVVSRGLRNMFDRQRP